MILSIVTSIRLQEFDFIFSNKKKKEKKRESKIENIILIIPPHTLTITCSKTRYSTNECSTGGDAR